MCRQCDWQEYVERVERMINSGDFNFAEDTLQGILTWVEENEHITPAQKKAVENIEVSIY